MQDNFVCAVESNARRFASRNALLWNNGKLTWSELDGFAAGFARYLSTQGVAAGDCVAILLPNGVEFVVAFLAILKLGELRLRSIRWLKTKSLPRSRRISDRN